MSVLGADLQQGVRWAERQVRRLVDRLPHRRRIVNIRGYIRRTGKRRGIGAMRRSEGYPIWNGLRTPVKWSCMGLQVQLQADSPNEMVCWTLDTDHDKHALFVRRIHFPGKAMTAKTKNGPVKHLSKLRKTLGAKVDNAQWAAMGTLTPSPFPWPKSGFFAFRRITHTRTEMTVVVDVDVGTGGCVQK